MILLIAANLYFQVRMAAVDPIIPTPVRQDLSWSKEARFNRLEIQGAGASWNPVLRDEFRHFQGATFGSESSALKISFSVRRRQRTDDSFRIDIRPHGVSIICDSIASETGRRAIRSALSLLCRLIRVKQGSYSLPTGYVECIPKIAWRGVHLFVGPAALAFHKRLWTNVLLPLGYNKAVLQCDLVQWSALAKSRSKLRMSTHDVAKLCNWYRSVGVEPIPLVQSLGHMDWLLGDARYRRLAVNPSVPYTLDPRKKGAAELLGKIWAEVIKVTKAKTIHFGLDEIALRGFPDRLGLATELWKRQLVSLCALAKRHNVRMMLWGDECLSPGQAPNSTNAPSVQEALERRSYLPHGALVGDWHYARLTPLEGYIPSLRLFKSEGFQPIACTWYRPENIRTFTLAAIQEGAGILQTTWAGYEGSENVMKANLKQFSAMVLAADYAWSGRKESPENVGYDPSQIFLDWYGR